MKIYIEVDGQVELQDHALPEVGIGRGKDNAIVIRDPRSSRNHCRVLHTPHGFFIEDLKSRNGTLLNGSRITKEALREGDCFVIGTTKFHFERDPRTTPAAAPPAGEAEPAPPREPAPARETVHSAGQTTIPSSPPEAPPAVFLEGLDGIYKGKRIPIASVPFTIGRRKSNSLRIDDGKASGEHARIVLRDEAYHVEDLDSRNGTLVNGRQVPESPLVPGCRLQIGDTRFRVHVPPVEGVTIASGPSEKSVGAEVVGENDFSQFDVQDFLQGSDSSRQPLVLVALLVVVGAILYFTVDVTLKVVASQHPDPTPKTNRIARNWSFEEPVPEGSSEIPGWSLLDPDSGSIALGSEGAAWPGRVALQVNPNTDSIRLVQAVSAPVSVGQGGAHWISGRVLNRGSFAAGVLVTWLRDSADGAVEIARSYASAVRGAGDEEEVFRKVFAPESATRARVACFVLQTQSGGAGASFDRIYFGEKPLRDDDEDASPEGLGPRDDLVFVDPLDVTVGLDPKDRQRRPITARVTPEGAVENIRRGVLRPLATIRPGIPGDAIGVGPSMSEAGVYGKEGGVWLTTRVPDMANDGWYSVEVRVEERPETLQCQYRVFQSGDELPARVAAFIELLGANGDASPMAFGEDGGRVELGASASSPVKELVFGSGREQLVLQLSPAASLRMLAARGDRLRPMIEASVAPSASADATELAVTVAMTPLQEELAVKRLFEKSRVLRDQRDLAAALDVLESIRRSYPWRAQDLKAVAAMEASIRAEVETAALELALELDLLKEVRSPFVYSALRERGEALAERFKGTGEVGQKIRGVLTSARSFWEGREGEPESVRLLKRGDELYSSGQVNLALVFLRQAERAFAADSGLDADSQRRLKDLFSLIDIKRGKTAPVTGGSR